MTNRTQELSDNFTAWMGRYSARGILEANPKAKQAELNALVRAILKAAPATDYLRWLDDVVDILDRNLKTVTWPTVSEVTNACKEASDTKYFGPFDRSKVDPLTINANRMKKGESVSEDWLYGRFAYALLRSGLVSKDLFNRYRQSHSDKLLATYGSPKAQRMEAELFEKHRLANESHDPAHPGSGDESLRNSMKDRDAQLDGESTPKSESTKNAAITQPAEPVT